MSDDWLDDMRDVWFDLMGDTSDNMSDDWLDLGDALLDICDD